RPSYLDEDAVAQRAPHCGRTKIHRQRPEPEGARIGIQVAERATDLDFGHTSDKTRFTLDPRCENRAIGIYQAADFDELPYRQRTEGDRAGLGAVLNDRQTIHKDGLSKDHELVIHDINTVDQAFDIFTKHDTCRSGDAIVVSDALDSDPHTNT